MKLTSIVRSLAFCLVAISFVVSMQPAAAQETVLGAQTPVDRLQARCDSVQATIRRLHTTDGLLRVNIGQTYNDISARLMARLNGRLALNRIDSARLVEITSQFESTRLTFNSTYNTYEGAVSSLVKIDCNARPTEYYAQLLITRDARHKLSTSVQELNDLVSEYRMTVEKLRHELNSSEQDKGAAS